MGSSAHEHFDIQAIMRGFGYAFTDAVFSMIRLSDSPDENRKFLAGLSKRMGIEVPTSIRTLDVEKPNTAVTIGLSSRGMRRLGVRSDVMHTFPEDFTQGMAGRAAINGDAGLSEPSHWEDVWNEGVDVLIGMYACCVHQRDRMRSILLEHIRESPCSVSEVGADYGQKMQEKNHEGKPRAVEHFGFRDGVSNTPVSGVTEIKPRNIRGAGRLDVHRNWHPIAAGEFLYGYTDEIGEIPPSPLPRSVGHNGTFLVYRKLSQDVKGFNSYVDEVASHFGLTGEEVAEKIVGRRRNGLPLVEQKTSNAGVNDFDYTKDERGRQCPLGSHIRRTNPRDTLGFQSLLVDRHRIVRRGITYDDNLAPDESKESEAPPHQSGYVTFPRQGLLFLALVIDIARQFEFIQSEWVNSGNDLNQGSARDPLIGAHDGGSGSDRMVYPSEGDVPAVVCSSIPRFVETRGGDYFFVPGLEAYRLLLDGQFGTSL